MSATVMQDLRQAITDYDVGAAEANAQEALRQGIDAFEILDALTETMRSIGDGFGQGVLFLPDLVGAAKAMSAATQVIEAALERPGIQREPVGVVVIGTVFGDVHSIGKSLVATLLRAEGFRVHDLGQNVRAEAFADAVLQFDADILAMSALMTTTAPEQKKVIEILKERGLRDKVTVMVGGGGITKQFAEFIGADGYVPTAPGAVVLARQLAGKSLDYATHG